MSTPSADEVAEETPGTDPAVEEKLRSIERARRLRQIGVVALIGVILVATKLGLDYVNFRVDLIAQRFPEFLEFAGSFIPPNFVEFTVYTKENEINGLQALVASVAVWDFWYVLPYPTRVVESLTMQRLTLTRAAYQTVLIGFLGTVLGFLPALTFGVLGSERVVPFPFNFLFRGTMSAIRAIPALIWIFLFIPFNTLSPFTAVLAIATDSIGNLGRLFVDELEEIEEGPIEAIRSTGASGSQTVGFGMLSQVARSYIAWTLYILEINTRIAVSLGVVGAGGLGVIIENNMPFEQYSRAAAGIVMIFVTVLTIEMVSTRIRARLRPGEHDTPSLMDHLRSFVNPYKWAGLTNPPERPNE